MLAMTCTLWSVQRQLQAYAGKLVGRLPKTHMGLTTGTATAGSTDWQVKLVDEDVPVICTIIATAEYCGEVVGALGRSIGKMLDAPFGQQVCLGSFKHALGLLGHREICAGGRLICSWLIMSMGAQDAQSDFCPPYCH